MKPTIPPISEIYEQIINRCLDQAEQKLVFGFIKKNQLEPFIIQSIANIEGIVHNVKLNNNLKVAEIKTIAYSFLKQFNRRLSPVEISEEKVTLKKLLVKTARGIMLEIEQQAPSYSDEVRKAIHDGLAQAAEVEEYDLKDFENYFPKGYTDISRMDVTVTKKNEFSEYFEWDHELADLDKLTYQLLSDYRCIKSKTEFKGLFSQPDNKGVVRWDANQSDLLILLVNRLYESGWVNVKKGKGIWKVVKGRFRDFDKNPLDIDPAKRLHLLKGKKPLKPALAEGVEKILHAIKVARNT